MAKLQPINFEQVLRELKQKRLELDRAIGGIEALIALGPLAGFATKNANSWNDEQFAENNANKIATSISSGINAALTGPGFVSGSFEFAANLAKNRRTSDRAHQAFAGMSILQASKQLLAQHARPMTAIELAQLLLQGGYHAQSANFSNTVAAVLNRCDKSGGNVIRVGKNLFTLVTERKGSTELSRNGFSSSITAKASNNPSNLQQDQLDSKDSHE
jgi:hypothetical protein